MSKKSDGSNKERLGGGGELKTWCIKLTHPTGAVTISILKFMITSVYLIFQSYFLTFYQKFNNKAINSRTRTDSSSQIPRIPRTQISKTNVAYWIYQSWENSQNCWSLGWSTLDWSVWLRIHADCRRLQILGGMSYCHWVFQTQDEIENSDQYFPFFCYYSW